MFIDVQVFSEEGEYWLLVPGWSFRLFATGHVRCLMVFSWFFCFLTTVGEFGNPCMYCFPYAMMTMRSLWMQRVGWLSITWNPFVWENEGYYMSQIKLISWWKWFKLVKKLFHFGLTSFAHVGYIVGLYNSFQMQIQWTIGNSFSNCSEPVFMWRNV